MPRMPFSDWIQTFLVDGRNETASVGMPKTQGELANIQ